MRKALGTWLVAVVSLVVLASGASAETDALPSWNDGPTKQSIVEFVARVTKDGGPDYVKPDDRVAVFDNDGTLWIEQPMYNQFVFAIDEVKAKANEHPEWKDKEPFKSVLAGDMKAVGAMGEKGTLEIVAATHSGMTTDQFNDTVKQWLETAKHPRFKVPYTDLVYQPMLELLAYLRANGFKTFIVSGGGVEFMRNFAEKSYGIPPEQVIGSSGQTEYQVWDAESDPGEAAQGLVRRRWARQTGGHQHLHRTSADLRLRQLRRRQGDAGMGLGLREALLRRVGAPHRCRAGIRL